MKEVVRGTKINNGISSKVAYILISILAIIGSLQISHSRWSFGEITLFFKGLCEWGCPSNTWQHRGRLERLSEACGSSAHAGVRSLNVLVCHGAVRRCPALLCRWRHSFYLLFLKPLYSEVVYLQWTAYLKSAVGSVRTCGYSGETFSGKADDHACHCPQLPRALCNAPTQDVFSGD